MKTTNKSTVTLLDFMGTDLTVVNAARVSFNKISKLDDNFNIQEKDIKLINYLAKHNHWSPFAHCQAQFRISAPIFVARQLVKHQIGLVWNEVSRRYVDDEPEFYFPDEWRGRPVNAKQGSDGVITQLKHEEGQEDLWGDIDNKWHPTLHVETNCYFSLNMYNKLLESGVAPEQARMVLPQNVMTEWWWTGSLVAFARVCKLRLDPHAQKETREVAEQIDASMKKLFPVSWNALIG